MQNIFYNISQVLGITIIHSLWQGMLVYFLLRMALAFRLSASKKYLSGLIALSVFTGWFIYTLVNEINIYHWLVIKPQNPSAMPLMLVIPAGIRQLNTEAVRYYYDIERYLPYLTALYAAGILYNAARLIISHRRISFIKRNVETDTVLQQKVNGFAGLLQISKRIKIGFSKLIDVPCMAGFLKPVILLPVTLTTLLTTEEIEAIILHELAHIKRNDYLINLIQQVIAVLLFFNPFAYLINRIINRERENCCDDTVVSISDKPLIYAGALLKIEQNSQNEWQLALAATGKKYHLLTRIERIMKTRKPSGSIRQAIAVFLIFAMATVGLAWLNPTVANGKLSVRNVKPAIEKAIQTLTQPVQQIFSKTDTTRKHIKAGKDTTSKTVTDISGDNSNGYQLFGFEDPEEAKLLAEMQKHINLSESYKDNPDFKALDKKVSEIRQQREFYDNDTLATIMINIEKFGGALRNLFKNSQDSLLIKKRDDLGKVVGNYYSSKSFKTMNAVLQKKHHIDPNKGDFSSQDYKNYQAELQTKIPVGIKNNINELVDASAKVYALYNSPQLHDQFNEMKFWLDSMKSYYKTSHITQKSAGRDSLSDIFRKYDTQRSAYILNPAINQEREEAHKTSDKLSAYIKANIDRIKQRDILWKNELRTSLGNTYDEIIQTEKSQTTVK